ncbi:MAG: hypothetical protein M3R51_06070 [Candidatus Eremiobacteraeota bacterium]|nr:hypothetical protein [Candidatus Eremiobacteraeota bacterium]
MKLRVLPGALVLGSLASVAGHAAGYGNQHVMGGAYHGMFLTLACAGAGSFALAALAIALAAPNVAAQGSIVARRLTSWMPRLWQVAAGTAGWFLFVESLEGTHPHGNGVVVVTALCAAVLLVHGLAKGAIALISAAIVRTATAPFDPRKYFSPLAFQRPLAMATAAHVRRRFARPPPSVMHRP